jgi:hypothetical protein
MKYTRDISDTNDCYHNAQCYNAKFKKITPTLMERREKTMVWRPCQQAIADVPRHCGVRGGRTYHRISREGYMYVYFCSGTEQIVSEWRPFSRKKIEERGK